MNDHLHAVTMAIDLSRKTFVRIKWNLAWAVVYNILALTLASGTANFFLSLLSPSSHQGDLVGDNILALTLSLWHQFSTFFRSN
jgi:cation transport ATPase